MAKFYSVIRRIRPYVLYGLLAAFVLAVAITAYRAGQERYERDLVYCIASESHCRTGPFMLTKAKDGTSVIWLDWRPFENKNLGKEVK